MPTVFITHAAADAEIASQFKIDVEKRFLNLCTLFVSSNLDSLKAGGEWANQIKGNLQEAAILIGLLSPIALQRGWVYFEFGAGWIRNIPVIPICHSGLHRDQLPPPLSIFQALHLNDHKHLSHIYGQIADAIGCAKPDTNFEELAGSYHSITEVKRIKELISNWMQQLMIWNPTLSKFMAKEADNIDGIMVPLNLEPPFNEFRHEVQVRDFMTVVPAGMAMGTPVGAQAALFRVTRGGKFDEMLEMIG